MNKTVVSILVFAFITGSLTFAYRAGYKAAQEQEQPAQCLTVLTENGAVAIPQGELSERWKESDEESAIAVSQDVLIKRRVESDGKGTFKLIETWSQSGDKVVKEYYHCFKWDGHELIEVYSDSKGNIKENHYQPTLFPKPAL